MLMISHLVEFSRVFLTLVYVLIPLLFLLYHFFSLICINNLYISYYGTSNERIFSLPGDGPDTNLRIGIVRYLVRSFVA